MNIQGPFFNPFLGFQNYEQNQNNYERLYNKITRLEKDIRILETRINKLEGNNIKTTIKEEQTDMYMI